MTSASLIMLDPFPDDLDPVELALFPHREARAYEPGVREIAERDGDRLGQRMRLVPARHAADRAEMEARRVAAVGDVDIFVRAAAGRHLVRGEAHLHR